MTKDRGNQGICDGVAGLKVAFEEVGLKWLTCTKLEGAAKEESFLSNRGIQKTVL